MKHAFCILAHTNQEQIGSLLKMLDNPRVDIFLHVDKKYSDFDESSLPALKYSALKLLDRRDVRWGDVSQVLLEVDIFNLALQSGEYVYFHHISAMDMPLKPINMFLDFCEKNKGAEFVNFEKYCNQEEVTLYHIFPRNQRAQRPCYYAYRFLQLSALQIQRLLKIKRNNLSKIHFYKGSNWVSITKKCAQEIVNNRQYFIDTYKWATCSDEKFIQTFLLMRSDCGFQPYKALNGNLRLVDWKRGHPYNFTDNDFEELSRSDLFWVRKVDMRIDGGLSSILKDYINKQAQEK